jgi:hypothetical protein
MKKLLLLIFVVLINSSCLSAEKTIFHYKKNQESNNCCNASWFGYDSQQQCVIASQLIPACHLNETLFYIATSSVSKTLDFTLKNQLQTLQKDPSQEVQKHQLHKLEFEKLLTNAKEKKFNVITSFLEEDNKLKYILRKINFESNYFLAQTYLFKFTLSSCTSERKSPSEEFKHISPYHVIEAIITKEGSNIRWHPEFKWAALTFISVSGLAVGYFAYHKWLKK